MKIHPISINVSEEIREPCLYRLIVFVQSLYPMLLSLLWFTAAAIDPLLDSEPLNVHKLHQGSFLERLSSTAPLASLLKTGKTFSH